jgi:hypothetical protein
MTPSWWTPIWVPTPQPPYPPEPSEPHPELGYDPRAPAVLQTADWTCSCASSAWLLNAIGDQQLGRPWNEWDVVKTLRAATYPGAVDPAYGLARADMYDLEVMFNTLGYAVQRKQRLTTGDVVAIAGTYPLQINGAAWYHHSGGRALGPGVLYLANPAPSWRGVGSELDSYEASMWGSWNGLWLVGRL